MNSLEQDDKVTSEATCTFRSGLPEQYRVSEELQIQLETDSQTKDITQIVKQMIIEEGTLNEEEEKDLTNRKLQFLVNDVFLT